MEKLRALLRNNTLRGAAISVFCTCIGLCSAYVMFFLYNPDQNALGALASVCMDLICMIILFILLCGFAFVNYVANRTTKIYTGLLVATIWALFLDFLNWAFDGALEFWHLTYWFTVGSLCMGSILAGLFTIYLYSYMRETHSFSKMRKSAIICALLNAVSFFLTFALAITGTAFQFVDGHYETGALYDVVTVIPVASVLYLTGFVIYHVKKIGVHDVAAAAGYIFFMVAGALIETAYRIGSTYVAVAIADIFIFVMLQNEIIAREKRNVLKWMKQSKTDELTGLLNRHAYEADILAMENSTLADNFVFVSIDVNSLKLTNDSLGHNAGDELLAGTTECLKTCFGSFGKLYRIGGDEFIALINVDEKQLSALKMEIIELTSGWKGNLVEELTISCGYVSKREVGNMNIRQMAILADHRMYEAKDDYYRSRGIDRRKK